MKPSSSLRIKIQLLPFPSLIVSTEVFYSTCHRCFVLINHSCACVLHLTGHETLVCCQVLFPMRTFENIVCVMFDIQLNACWLDELSWAHFHICYMCSSGFVFRSQNTKLLLCSFLLSFLLLQHIFAQDPRKPFKWNKSCHIMIWYVFIIFVPKAVTSFLSISIWVT
jgi:hypothetical protein